MIKSRDSHRQDLVPHLIGDLGERGADSTRCRYTVSETVGLEDVDNCLDVECQVPRLARLMTPVGIACFCLCVLVSSN